MSITHTVNVQAVDGRREYMSNQEKFFGLAYKVLKFFVWWHIVFGTLVLGGLIGLVLRYKFF